MNYKRRPEVGDLVWIEYQGKLEHAVYIANSDVFMLGDGTRIEAASVEWFADFPGGDISWSASPGR